MINLYFTYFDSDGFERSIDWEKMLGCVLPDKSRIYPSYLKSPLPSIQLLIEDDKFVAHFNPENIYTAYRMLKERYGDGK